jgi:hypothetical protein
MVDADLGDHERGLIRADLSLADIHALADSKADAKCFVARARKKLRGGLAGGIRCVALRQAFDAGIGPKRWRSESAVCGSRWTAGR